MKSTKNNEGKGLIIKYRNDEFEKKNQFSIKDCIVERQLRKNNKVKYPVIKQFKIQTIQTKHGIKQIQENN